jgi:hypothetical protein
MSVERAVKEFLTAPRISAIQNYLMFNGNIKISLSCSDGLKNFPVKKSFFTLGIPVAYGIFKKEEL